MENLWIVVLKAYLVGSLIIKKDFELSKLNEDGIIFLSDI
jgi:hypothetical protein